jgi:hypothetical protein
MKEVVIDMGEEQHHHLCCRCSLGVMDESEV